jgi:D-alanyl-D-alanine carboxypeptidase/D-alanyl-D-alanine-endopeptidase (penicillin-binding protein 4)
MPLRSPRLCSSILFIGTFSACLPAAFAQTVSTPPPAPFPTGPATDLGRQIAAIAAEPAVMRAHWGIAITTLDGTPIYGLNEGEFFRPASNNKLFTTAAAMHLLGPSSRVVTVVKADGPTDSSGTLSGNVTLQGAGDANISGRTFPYISAAERKRLAAAAAAQGQPPAPPADPLRSLNDLAQRLAAGGVHHVTGDIIGDDSLWPWEPYANDWSIDDAVWGYGAPVSALTVNDNQLDLTVSPGAEAGKPGTVTLSPEIGYYQVHSDVKTVAAKAPASIRIDRDPGSRTIRVLGTVAVGEPYSTEVAIEDPAEFAAQAFKIALESQGVKVDGKAVPVHKRSADTAGFSEESHAPIPTLPRAATMRIQPPYVCAENCPPHAELASPTMADDVTLTLKVSQNLHAELLLHRLGAAYGTEASAAQGTRVVRQFLINAGLDPDDFIFYDGSGLSGHDLVTPRATAKLLAYATQQPWFPQWRAALPVGGEDGTLAGRFAKPPLKDHLFAKTGTLSEARALSGYIDCASGRTVIFSVMVDNHAPNTPADRDAMDRIVAAIAAAN